MTNQLYRQDVLDHQTSRLYGEVILSAPPATWWITALLIILMAVGGFVLFGINIDTKDGAMSVLSWLISRMG